MELRQVAYFLAVVDHGGFGRAATALRVAQPSLSEGIRRLEADLGVALFERRGREVRLTHAGVDALGPARAMLRDAEHVRRAVDRHGELLTGVLDLVALPSLADHPVARLIGRFRVLAPSVSVRVATPASALELERMLLDGRCEVGITERSEGARGRGIDQLAFGTQELLAVFPPPQRDAGSPDPVGVARAGRARVTVSLDELAAAPLVLSPVGTSVRDHVDRALHSIGAAATVVVETNQREAIVPLVLAGAGATVLPAPVADVAAASGAIVRRFRPRMRRDLVVAVGPGRRSPAAAAFVAMAADEVPPGDRRVTGGDRR
ncbi:MAG: LysR family transcriptional regulator [Acidimicrobiales bacterium]|nr:LysR family transcriptional regulator [Acidimicrobiales bacterium]MCB9395726.1 LysR family transcriptional regulator [Acidimicrobiaceae bacterium]